jgi:hypothetical protein
MSVGVSVHDMDRISLMITAGNQKSIGRTVLLRGINVAAAVKVPLKSSQS